mgnify:CR=1 FL=1
MAYVKISDPKIIDLSTVHQIINVVNQHSDNITALTNNFGSTYVGSAGTVVGDSTEYQYDIASQQIVYGRTQLDADNTYATSGGLGYYKTTVTFVGQAFSAAPVVTATINTGSVSKNFMSLIVRVANVTTSTFDIIVRSLSNTTETSAWLTGTLKINVNWTAIGPK